MRKHFRQVGRAHPAADAIAKVQGALTYGTDLARPGLLHAQLVLSPHAHAAVCGIDARAALASPGVVGAFTHLNSPARPYNRYRIMPAQSGCIDDERIFTSIARFAGDRVAAVVASSREAARAGARRLRIDYAVRPAALTLDAALAPGAPAVHGEGNLLHAFEHATAGAVPECAAAVRVATTVTTQRLHHAAIEPHVALADYDADGKLTIWSACQSVFGVRTVVADLLELPYHRVRVVKVPMGGSFGGKQESILEPVVAFLAMAIGRPVALALDREECIRATMVRPEQRSTVSTLSDAAGRLLELDIDTLLNAGAYASSSPDYAEAMAHKMTRLYRVGRYRHRGRVAYTHTVVGGGMRGWGAPDIVTCVEIHLEQVARRLQLDPLALRLRNLVSPNDTDPLSGLSLGDARVRECLQQGAARFQWAARRALARGTGRYRRGVGLACAAHKNGMLSASWPESATMTLQLNEDGSVALNAAVHEVGAGSLVTLKTIIAETLELPQERISAREADTETSPFDFGCFGSRMTYVVGAGAKAAAEALRARLIAAGAQLLGCEEGALLAADGWVRRRDGAGEAMSFGTIAQRARHELVQEMIVTHTYRGISNPGSYCVQFAQVEVDLLTGLVRVLDMLVAVDIGRAINRLMVEGQCRGAIQAGIGSALTEQVALDEAGRAGSGGFKNYHLVNAVDMPPVEVLLIEHDGDDGPYGAKSVGEIATVPTAAAIANAVNHALGTSLSTLPLTPERIVAALQEPGLCG